jgi:hypothetical protein
MNNQNSSQLELFSQGPGYSESKVNLSRYFLRRIWVYEKVILVTIGFIITAVIAFSLGVEKGKTVAVLNSNARFDMAKAKYRSTQEQPLVERKNQIPVPESETVPSQKSRDNLQNYTIQLASYKSRTYAQKEADSLKKKGLKPLIVSKGGYVVLCVGSFRDKDNAKTLLPELGKQYRGCFIRRI